MSCTSSGATLESFRTAWKTGTSRSSGKVSCKRHDVKESHIYIHVHAQVILIGFIFLPTKYCTMKYKSQWYMLDFDWIIIKAGFLSGCFTIIPLFIPNQVHCTTGLWIYMRKVTQITLYIFYITCIDRNSKPISLRPIC